MKRITLRKLYRLSMGCCEAKREMGEMHLEEKRFVPKRSDTSALLSFRSSNFVSTVKGNLLDYYDVRTLLGQGGFGKVYSAVSKSSGTLRAIKALDKSTLTKDSAERVQREIEILKTLDHPNIVKIVEVIEDNRYINIVQELCTGGELFDRILKQKLFSEEAAARHLYQILSAVTHCHRLQIVHRDLKPENILFETDSPDSLLKVIDFGISTKYLQGTPLRKKYGTVREYGRRTTSPRRCCLDRIRRRWTCGAVEY